LGNIYQTGQQIKDAIVSNGLDNRRHPRRSAKWQFQGYDKNRSDFFGVTDNISESGLLLIVDQSCHNKFDVGGRILIDFNVCYKAKLKTFKGIATIKHVSIAANGIKLGVEFIKIEKEKQEWLSAYALKKI
jgi:hypothetical protein